MYFNRVTAILKFKRRRNANIGTNSVRTGCLAGQAWLKPFSAFHDGRAPQIPA
jgi:hypothetical protein